MTHVIKILEYTGKLSDIYQFLDYSLTAIEDPMIKDRSLKKWMEGVPSLARDERFFNVDLLGDQLEQFASMVEGQFRDSFLKKFADSSKIILNLSLVMMCTIMELYFEHVLKTIMDA